MNANTAAAFVCVLLAIAVLVLLCVAGAWLWQVAFPRLFDAVRRHFQRTEIDVDAALAPYQETGRGISHVTIVDAPGEKS